MFELLNTLPVHSVCKFLAMCSFDFLESPPEDAVDGALRLLRLLGALDAQHHLTDVGKRMAAFPLDPRFTKVLFSANELGCT